MRRTAAHVVGSPNPAQLEMRILANHGADPRFAFLRGRWAHAWRLAKGKRRVELEREAEQARKEVEGRGAKPGGGIGGLAGYGDSDSDEDSGAEEEKEQEDADASEVAGAEKQTPAANDEEHTSKSIHDDEAAKAARRARAKEWAEKRRALKEGEAA